MNITNVEKTLKKIFENDSSGHDYWHTIRVYKNALKIAETEECDTELVAVAALLHDVDDPKLFSSEGYKNARGIMSQNGFDDKFQGKVIAIIKEVSFRGAESVAPETTEGKIVQDADRLDAIGAIGVARAFAFGGSRGRLMYDPDIPPQLIKNSEEYLKNKGTVINHFYEKLFLLKDMMNTKFAKAEACRRTDFMNSFIDEFLSEWNSSK